jgi:outer membrane receptor protein involved in Fe transport
MSRSFFVGLGLLAVACTSAPRVSPTPSPGTATAADSSATIYMVDDVQVTRAAALSVPSNRIASVEVIKGKAAIAVYGPSARAGVVVIHTKKDRQDR